MKRHSRATWIIGGAVGTLVILAVLVVVGAFVYIHFIEGPAPKPLALPPVTGKRGTTPSSALPPTGTWKATTASVVGYRVNEVLAGQNNVAVGRTHSVTGSITVAGTNGDAADVTAAAFSAQLATVHSDERERDDQFDGRIMDVSQYPTATFTLGSPISLGTVPVGRTVHESATGQLMLHGQTHAVTFGVSARDSGTQIDITGSIPITFATWGISNPSFGSFVRTDNHGTLEFLLIMDRSSAT